MGGFFFGHGRLHSSMLRKAAAVLLLARVDTVSQELFFIFSVSEKRVNFPENQKSTHCTRSPQRIFAVHIFCIVKEPGTQPTSIF